MIIEFVMPNLQGMDVDDIWFQQDDAACHTALETILLLHGSFSGRDVVLATLEAMISTTGHFSKHGESDHLPFHETPKLMLDNIAAA